MRGRGSVTAHRGVPQGLKTLHYTGPPDTGSWKLEAGSW
jgi:hypothetical protein